jgi:hypothetical protein
LAVERDRANGVVAAIGDVDPIADAIDGHARRLVELGDGRRSVARPRTSGADDEERLPVRRDDPQLMVAAVGDDDAAVGKQDGRAGGRFQARHGDRRDANERLPSQKAADEKKYEETKHALLRRFLKLRWG